MLDSLQYALNILRGLQTDPTQSTPGPTWSHTETAGRNVSVGGETASDALKQVRCVMWQSLSWSPLLWCLKIIWDIHWRKASCSASVTAVWPRLCQRASFTERTEGPSPPGGRHTLIEPWNHVDLLQMTSVSTCAAFVIYVAWQASQGVILTQDFFIWMLSLRDQVGGAAKLSQTLPSDIIERPAPPILHSLNIIAVKNGPLEP